MRIYALSKITMRGHKGYAIIWRMITDESTQNYRVTFNNQDQGLALDSTNYTSRSEAGYVATAWLEKQPERKHPDFKYICKNPRTIEAETNDCVVRALSLAFNRDYSEVHTLCAKVGRKARRGMLRAQTDKVIQLLSNKSDAKLERYARGERCTLATFAKENPTGNFIVIKSGHAVALIDGVYHDNTSGQSNLPRSIVQACYRAK
jgi:hypothetical protein